MEELERSHLYREIREQPEVLARLLKAEIGTARSLATEIRRRGIEYVVIAARGTSDNAARYAQYLLGAINGLVVALATPSLFTIYGKPPRLRGALVLGISQSGRSPDIVSVVAEGRRQGALTAAITNAPTADLGQVAEYVLGLHAGIEHSIAATKTYTSELAAIALLCTQLSDDVAQAEALDKVPQQVRQALDVAGHACQSAQQYRHMQSCAVVGRGYNYATAFELALKLKELTYAAVEAYSSADFLHGPLALVDPGFPMIVIAPSGQMLAEMLGFMSTLRSRGAELMVISDATSALELGHVALPLPAGVPEWLSPLTSVVPGQLFAMHLAQARGHDVDHPRGLHKVTETV